MKKSMKQRRRRAGKGVGFGTKQDPNHASLRVQQSILFWDIVVVLMKSAKRMIEKLINATKNGE